MDARLSDIMMSIYRIGVDLLMDGQAETYWQSDGSQPHLITLEFQQMVHVSKVALQTNYSMDESYTPHRIAVRVGTRKSDIRVVRTEEVQEPQGWIVIPLFEEDTGVPYVSGRILQIVIISNHQNGRDTHVRQMKVFGPREDVLSTLTHRPHQVSWMTSDATMYATCR